MWDIRTVAYEMAADMTVLELLRDANVDEAKVVWGVAERIAKREIASESRNLSDQSQGVNP